MKDSIKYQQRVLKGITEKLGPDADFGAEFQNIIDGKSILSFRERQYIVLVVARQNFLKNTPDDSVEV